MQKECKAFVYQRTREAGVNLNQIWARFESESYIPLTCTFICSKFGRFDLLVASAILVLALPQGQ